MRNYQEKFSKTSKTKKVWFCKKCMSLRSKYYNCTFEHNKDFQGQQEKNAL